MRAAFRNWLLLLGPAFVAAGAGEALATALRAESGRAASAVLATFIRTLAYSSFGWVLLAAASALLIAILVSSLSAKAENPVLLPSAPHQGLDLCAGAVPAISIHLAVGYVAVLLVAENFRNRELSALLLIALAGFGLVATIAFALLLARLAARLRARSARPALAKVLVLGPGVGLSLALLVGLAVHNSSGFAQLDPWLFLIPMLIALGALLTRRLGLPNKMSERWAERGLGGFGLGSFGLWIVLSFLDPFVASTIADFGVWSRYAVRALRAATDFDRDGYSSWFSGGDCAAFDAKIGPGVAEIAEDGKDNNCIGGDAKRVAKVTPPAWQAALPDSVPRRMNLLVVTVETLRHDHVSFLGYGRDNTPRLRAFGKDAQRFSRMYAAAPMTRLAVTSLFSSYSPSEVPWVRQGAHKAMRRIASSTPWLPATLNAAGYRSIAVTTDFRAFTSAESAGFDRGFDVYDTSTRLKYSGGTMHGFPAEEQVTKAIAHLEAAKAPFFLWLHLFEPHYVYEQPPAAPVYGADERARYDAEIWEADRQIGRLLDHLAAKGELERTLVFVSGDHGEAFGEHGDRWHGSNLHDPQVRTAALLRVPGLAGKVVPQAVTFTDVAPTLLNLLRVEEGYGRLHGRNLVPLLLGGKLEPDRFVIEAFSVDDGHAFMMAVVDMPYKLIYVEEARKLELFELESDPEERRPLRRNFDREAAETESYLFQYLESTAKRF